MTIPDELNVFDLLAKGSGSSLKDKLFRTQTTSELHQAASEEPKKKRKRVTFRLSTLALWQTELLEFHWTRTFLSSINEEDPLKPIFPKKTSTATSAFSQFQTRLASTFLFTAAATTIQALSTADLRTGSSFPTWAIRASGTNFLKRVTPISTFSYFR